jgi:hypothetical protein
MASQDACICPVSAAAAIARRIRKYPGSSQNSPILTVTVNGHLQQVTSTHMINALRDAVGAIGEVKLGIKKEDVGTHLIWGMLRMHDHANWMLVQRCLSQVHQKASNGIQPKCGKEDVIVPEFQTHPSHSHKDPTR